ncbi:MAG TPA: MarR family transcriptional regulator [Alphaproteobacteria bacterium]|jgi:DNA-binding MarR family transcriptional regulator|nr:MarR family transcriptional regulator [Alphaproteobacteria bacterium]
MHYETPERALALLLHDTARLLRKRFDRYARASAGITRAQFATLAILARNEGLTQVALAEQLEITPITLARLIDRLEAEGWVERRRDPDDRRAHRLFLRQAGRDVLERVRPLAQRFLEETFADLSPQARLQLIDTLTVVRGSLSERDPAGAVAAPERRRRHG